MICLNREQLFRYAHHLLNPQEVAAVRAHLGGCSRCREAVINYQRLDAVLDAWKPAEPSAGFDTRVRQAVRAQPAGRAGWSFGDLRWARTLALVSLGALVIAGVVWLARSQRPGLNPSALATKQPSVKVPAPISPEVAKLKPATVARPQVKNSGKLEPMSSSVSEDEDAGALDDDDLLANFDILSELPKRDARVSD
jgi:anti-sigma factor RsiW